MIREEKNALVLLLLFGVGAFVLYVFVLRPALDQALVAPPVEPEVAPPTAPVDPILEQRPKAAKRMLTARALLRDAATGLPVTRFTAKVEGIADIAEPEAREAGNGVVLLEYLPPDASFAVEFTAPGYRARTLHQLRGAAKSTLELGVIALVPERTIKGEVRTRGGVPLAKVRIGAFELKEAANGDDEFERCRQLAEALRLPAVATTETDADGRFVLTPLEPRNYALYCTRDDLAAAVMPNVTPEFGDVETRIVTDPVPAGRARVSLDDGRPASGAVVTLVEARLPLDGQLSLARSLVAADGSLAVRALPAVPHYVFVAGGDAAACGFGPYSFPTDRALRLTVPVGVAMTGVVVDPFNAPIRGARVEARGLHRGAFASIATTDLDGRYRLTGLAVGSGHIRVTARGYAADQQVVPVASFGAEHRATLYRGGVLEGRVLAGGKPVLGARVTVAAQDARAVSDEHGRFRIEGLALGRATVSCEAVGFARREREVEIAHGKPATIEFDPELGGEIRLRVMDSAEAPIRGARVAAFRLTKDGRLDPRVAAFADTDAQGYARLRDLENGVTFTVYASASGYSAARTEEFVLSADHLKKGFALSLDRGAEIHGKLSDTKGAPISGAAIRIESLRSDALECHLLERIATPVITGSDGTFRLVDLPPGEFTVLATAPGYQRTATVRIPLSMGELRSGLEITTSVARPIFGTVETPDGRPLPMSIVKLSSKPDAKATRARVGADPSVTTDAAGHFYFLSGVGGIPLLEASAEHVGEATLALEDPAALAPYRVVIDPTPVER